MIVHIDRLIKHLKRQIYVAEKLKSDWVYITAPQAKKCLELAEAEDVIMEMINEKSQIVRCKDCKYRDTGNWCNAHMDHYPDDDWFCADGERRSNDG